MYMHVHDVHVKRFTYVHVHVHVQHVLQYTAACTSIGRILGAYRY